MVPATGISQKQNYRIWDIRYKNNGPSFSQI